jgi:nucleotide-binding universal stress UspA family protein
MKIMVTLDESRFAEAVVEPAAQLAREAKAEVYLVQVLDPSDVHSTLSGPPDYVEATREAAIRGDPFTGFLAQRSWKHLARP